MKSIVMFFLLLTIGVNAQDSAVAGHKKASILFGYSAQSTYRKLTANSSHASQKQALDTLETKKFGQTFSFLFERKITPSLRLQSGLRFSQYGEQTKTYLQTNTINYRSLNNRIAVPLFVNFCSNEEKRISFCASGGIEFGYLVSSTANYNNPLGSTETITAPDASTKLFTLSAEINAGVKIPLTNTWQLTTLLNHQRILQSVVNGPLKKYPYASGLFIGFSHNF